MPTAPKQVQSVAPSQSAATAPMTKLYTCEIGQVCEYIGDKYCNAENNFCSDSFKQPKYVNQVGYDVAQDGSLINDYIKNKAGFKAIDLWLVVDASKSFEEKRKAATEVVAKAYVDDLSKKVDVSIGIIVSHSKYSNYSVLKNKNIFYQKSTEPRILRFTPDMKDSERAALRQVLIDKMTQMPEDRELSDNSQVDFGLYNYSQALSKSKLKTLDELDVFSAKRTFVTYFISEKRDICADESLLSSIEEHDWYQAHCPSISSPYLLRQKINEIFNETGERPNYVGGFIYSDKNQKDISANLHVSYGYTSFIDLMGGGVVDLQNDKMGWNEWSQVSYKNGMKKIVDIAHNGNYQDSYYIVDGKKCIVDLKNLEKESFKVYADGKPVTAYLDYQTNKVRVIESGEKISFHYRLK